MIPSFKHGVIASSRPRVVAAAGGGFNSGDLPFNDMLSIGFGNTVTATKSGTIHLSASQDYWGGSGFIEFYKNNTPIASFNIEGPYTWTGQPISISNNDQLKFNIETSPTPEATNGLLYIRNDSISGSLIETITVYIEACLLTTAVVRYMGLLDNGPELTAMRLLREHYKNISGYDQIIREYYQNSPAIISAINSLADSSIEYNYIYNTVISVMNHVNAEEWQQAHDLYMAMYNDLKKRYLG